MSGSAEDRKVKSQLKRSVCPYDCPDTCGLLIEVVDGQVVKVSGDPEHPFTQGTLCPKMTHYERTVYSSQRITQPLLRVGEKGTGQFRAISWQEAIQAITAQWQNIISNYGAEAILPYSFAGTMGVVQRHSGEAFFHRLGASRLARTICSPAKDYGWQAVMGDTLAPHPSEVEESDFILLWSTNALATNIHFLKKIRKAKKQGAVLWVVDTYENPTVQLADKVVLVRPGSDGALALGMMHILVRDGLVDQQFIAENVQGFELLKTDVLPAYTPAKVSQITGLEINVLEEMAACYGRARAPFIILGAGLTRYGNGAMTVRSIVSLPALVGAWVKRGGGLFSSVSTKVLAMAKVKREDFMAKPTRIVNMNQLGEALNCLTDPPIMSLYVYHSNPVIIAPDQNQIIKGLERENLFTVVHERFMTDTALYADLVLPAASSLEYSDIYRSYGYYSLQRVSAAIPPLGQAKSNWDVFALLAKALGFAEPYFSQTADELIDQLIDPTSPWLKNADLVKLQEGWPIELCLPENYKTTYLTPSGKIELFNPDEAEPLPVYCEPHGDNAPYYLMSAPSLYSLNSSFNERPDLVRKKEEASLLMNPNDAAAKNIQDGQQVIAFNERGEVPFILRVTRKVPPGVVVSEGLFWGMGVSGGRTVNALTSQRLTDRADGSTLYDVKVDVRAAEQLPRLNLT